jgi:hypothetical protein
MSKTNCALLTYIKSTETLTIERDGKKVKLSTGDRAKRNVKDLAKEHIILIKKK